MTQPFECYGVKRPDGLGIDDQRSMRGLGRASAAERRYWAEVASYTFRHPRPGWHGIAKTLHTEGRRVSGFATMGRLVGKGPAAEHLRRARLRYVAASFLMRTMYNDKPAERQRRDTARTSASISRCRTGIVLDVVPNIGAEARAITIHLTSNFAHTLFPPNAADHVWYRHTVQSNLYVQRFNKLGPSLELQKRLGERHIEVPFSRYITVRAYLGSGR